MLATPVSSSYRRPERCCLRRGAHVRLSVLLTVFCAVQFEIDNVLPTPRPAQATEPSPEPTRHVATHRVFDFSISFTAASFSRFFTSWMATWYRGFTASKFVFWAVTSCWLVDNSLWVICCFHHQGLENLSLVKFVRFAHLFALTCFTICALLVALRRFVALSCVFP